MSEMRRLFFVLCAAALCASTAAAQDFLTRSYPVVPSVSLSPMKPLFAPLARPSSPLLSLLPKPPSASPVQLGMFRPRFERGCFDAACARYRVAGAPDVATEALGLLERDRTRFHDLSVVEIAEFGGRIELEAFRSRARSGWLDGAGLFAGSRTAQGALRTMSPAPRRRTSFGLRLDFRLDRD
jgi:hypothetical protein